jgi:hypothetical protein
MTDHRNSGRTGPGADESRLFAIAGRNRALVLLLALVAQILLTSLDIGNYLLPGLLRAVVVIGTVVVAADSRRHLQLGLVLGVPSLVLAVVTDYVPFGIVDWIGYGFTVALFVFIIRLMLQKIFRAQVVTLDTIGYALCTYVLLGTLWTLFYAPLAVVNPDAFSQPVADPDGHAGASLIYFSFVTLTTLGYGDISPVSPLARSLAILQALTGTLFLAVLISRLVGAYGSRQE